MTAPPVAILPAEPPDPAKDRATCGDTSRRGTPSPVDRLVHRSRIWGTLCQMTNRDAPGATAPDALGRRPFTWRQSVDAGISRRELKGCQRLAHGVYLRRGIRVDPWIEGQAALLIGGPAAFVSHHLAARIYGAVVPRTPHWHISVPPGAWRSKNGAVKAHASARVPSSFRSLPITTPSDTFLDLATHLDLVDLVVLGDCLVRKNRISPEMLVESMDEAAGKGGILARRAAQLVRRGVDSSMESRCRMLRVLSGLPELETDIRIYDEHGRVRRRLDAGDRKSRTAVEYDGRHHIQRQEQWVADLGRREELEDDEWRIVVLVAPDIYSTPGRSIERMAKVFRARGMRLGPSSDEWRRYFTDRPAA